jgi:hypothetical protein
MTGGGDEDEDEEGGTMDDDDGRRASELKQQREDYRLLRRIGNRRGQGEYNVQRAAPPNGWCSDGLADKSRR